MENMINLNELEQSNTDLQTFVLSDTFKVFKTTFQNGFTKNAFLKRVEENKSLYYKKDIEDSHSLEMNIECPEFKSIDNFYIETLQKLDDISTQNVSRFSWVYTQTKDFSAQWMHEHTYLHRFNKSHINTQWVCVFYISIPDEMKKEEGNLVFKNEKDEFFYFTPKEKDVVIFSGNLPHMTVPNQSSDTNRISYVSNFNFLTRG